MRDNQYALAAIFSRDGVIDAAEPENNIAPAFAARWAMIELAQRRIRICLFRVDLPDACFGHAVKDAELFFAQSLIEDKGDCVRIHPGAFEKQRSRFMS